MKPVYLLLWPCLTLLLLGCDLVNERITAPAQPSATPIPFSTATPGGMVSVWINAPTESANATSIANPQGEVLGPIATATAAQQRILSATQTAAAPTPQPVFQPSDCPAPRGVSAPPTPTDFAQYAAVISVYLSNGGAPSVLESTLRQWGAITAQGGVVQADTDLTGDKLPEVLVSLFNPFTYNPEALLNSGQLMIFGCDAQAYRLLYTSNYNPGIALPVLHRVGDMNGDGKAEIVYDTQSCTTSYCAREGAILSWNPTFGAFEPLNNQQLLAVNGRLGVADVDSDGILEVSITSFTPTSANSGPTRGSIDVWDWTGQNYVLAVRTPDESRYRIHRLYDADAELTAGNRRSALRGYFEVRDDPDLLAWTTPNESAWLRAFANYRILITYARNGDERSEEILAALAAENPEGSPAATLAAMGQAFMEVYRSGAGVGAACQSALGVASTRPDVLGFLNSYGVANRTYSLADLCPF
jgi:hypothetical protein